MQAGQLSLYGLALGAATLLAGCQNVGAPPPVGAVNTPALVAPPPPASGVIGAAISQTLNAMDQGAAIAAQQEAIESGNRKSWRGGLGAYGFVTPGAESGGCREYTHRIFINGRPQEAKGRACQENGIWRVVS